MDLVLTIVFFICAILGVAGALAASLGQSASLRLLGLLALAVGAAGTLASLSAGYAALVALVCLGASAILIGGVDPGTARNGASWSQGLPAQLGALASAVLLVLLVVVAVRGPFAGGGQAGNAFDAAALGRLFFGRDALAVEAAGAALAAALAAGVVARSRRS